MRVKFAVLWFVWSTVFHVVLVLESLSTANKSSNSGIYPSPNQCDVEFEQNFQTPLRCFVASSVITRRLPSGSSSRSQPRRRAESTGQRVIHRQQSNSKCCEFERVGELCIDSAVKYSCEFGRERWKRRVSSHIAAISAFFPVYSDCLWLKFSILAQNK